MAENEPGVVEKAKGMAKEAAGAVVGNEQMRAEGRVEREEGDDTEGNKKYYRTVIRESMERSGLS